MIVGLGNPGIKYSETRHNIGFKVVQSLANQLNTNFNRETSEYLVSKGLFKGNPFALLLPLTFMNHSGKAIKRFKENNDFDLKEMLVICDDINLDTGKIRLRAKGTHGGHNGLLSIINELNTSEFSRLRIGVGKNFDKNKQAEYLLSSFETREIKLIELSIEIATEICKNFLRGGLKEALEYYSKIQSGKKFNSTKNGVVE